MRVALCQRNRKNYHQFNNTKQFQTDIIVRNQGGKTEAFCDLKNYIF